MNLLSGQEAPFAGSAADGFGGTTANAATLHLGGLQDVASDQSGDLFIVAGESVFEVTSSGTARSVVAGRDVVPSPDPSALDGVDAGSVWPLGLDSIAISPDGHLFLGLAKFYGNTGGILELGDDGRLHYLFGTGTTQFPAAGSMPAADAEVDYPVAMSFDAGGRLLVADSDPNSSRPSRVYRWDRATSQVSVLTGNPYNGCSSANTSGQPATAWCVGGLTGIASPADGSIVVAMSCNLFRIAVDGTASWVSHNACSTNTNQVGDGGPVAGASFGHHLRVTADPSGGYYLADADDYRVRHVDSAGTISTLAGRGDPVTADDGASAATVNLGDPTGVTRDSQQRLVLSDKLTHRVRRVNADGTITTIAGTGAATCQSQGCGDGGLATAAVIIEPGLLAYDSIGDLFVGDDGAVRKITPVGVISTVAGSHHAANCVPGWQSPPTSAGQLCLGEDPSFTLDANGNLYVANDEQVYRVSPSGAVTVVAGDAYAAYPYPQYYYNGDGGPATSTRFHDIGAIALDGSGGLLIADNGNREIRRVNPSGVVERFAGNGEPEWNCSDPDCGSGGRATSTPTDSVHDLVTDSAGNVDLIEGRTVRRIWPNGLITVIAGRFPSVAGQHPLLDGVDPRDETLGVVAGYTGNNSDVLDLADSSYWSPNHRVWHVSGLDNLPEPQGAHATITAGPADGGTSGSDVSFSYTSDEQYATFTCSLDGAAASYCTSPTSYHLTPGPHTFSVTAMYGDASAGPTTVHWTAGTATPTPTTTPTPTATPTPVSSSSPSASPTPTPTQANAAATAHVRISDRYNHGRLKIWVDNAVRYLAYNHHTSFFAVTPTRSRNDRVSVTLVSHPRCGIGSVGWYFRTGHDYRILVTAAPESKCSIGGRKIAAPRFTIRKVS